ncbi:MAG: sporulation integral membrane protein YtvI [Clostridiales bacterium]|jgi:sporulation integral membrane protein YtvI|nr:sporulation integral membrane protein YtvI [Clostridiales bacterium]
MILGFYRANKELINKILFLTTFIVFVYLFVHYLFGMISPFVIGYLISLILVPFVNFCHTRLRVHRGIGTAVFMAIILFLLTVLGMNIVSTVIAEIKSFAENWPAYLSQLSALGSGLSQKYDDLLAFVPEQFTHVAETALSALAASFTSALSAGVKEGSFSLVRSVPSFLMSTLLMIISVFFFTKDKKLIQSSVQAVAPVWLSESFRTIKKALYGAIWGYVKAQLILMSITASVCVLGLTLIGFPYALLIGLAASMIDALPVFGVGFVLWPLAFINVVTGNYAIAMGILVIDVIVIIVRQFLEPKILGEQIGLHPLMTLMAIYLGLQLFGVLGFVIGPMILVVTKVILESGKQNKRGAVTKKEMPKEHTEEKAKEEKVKEETPESVGTV